jgi:predicted nucleotidyltransferase
MNIHIKEEFNKLLDDATIFKCEIGSPMYDLCNEKSDTDFLKIYVNNTNSYLWMHHQFQFKDNNVDYNYTTIQSFIRNLLTGDATINFEVLWSHEIVNSKIKFLIPLREKLISYNVIKSYLGLAKRDFSQAKRGKKLSHAVRGIMSAEYLLNGEFSLTGKDKWSKANWSDKDNNILLKQIKNDELTNDELKEIKINFIELMSELRDKLNERLRTGTIHRMSDVETLKEIDANVMKISSENFNYGFNYDVLYDVLENGVKY